MIRTRRTNTGSFLFAFGLIACGPNQVAPPIEATPEGRQMAKAGCSAREDCECSDSRFESTEQCETESAASIDAALASGIAVDSCCFETVLASEI